MADWRDELVEIAGCELCDEGGIRLNQLGRCDHVDYGAIAKRGKKLCEEAMKEKSR